MCVIPNLGDVVDIAECPFGSNNGDRPSSSKLLVLIVEEDIINVGGVRMWYSCKNNNSYWTALEEEEMDVNNMLKLVVVLVLELFPLPYSWQRRATTAVVVKERVALGFDC